MAKKTSGPNKSQEIRDYYVENPDAKPKQVVEALAAKGVVVTPAFVSTIKSTTGKKGPKTTRGPRVKRATKTTTSTRGPQPAAVKAGGSVTIDSLVRAKGLVKELGGIDNAMSALAALKRLAD